jgi:hypothetical protein
MMLARKTLLRDASSLIDAALATPLPVLALVLGQSLVSGSFAVDKLFGGLALVYFVTLLLTIVAGIPVFLLLKSLGLARWPVALATGAVFGVVVEMAVRSPNPVPPIDLGLFGLSGALAGLMFWKVWRAPSSPRALR